MRSEWYCNYHYFLMVQLVASGLLRSDLIIYLVLAYWRLVLHCHDWWGVEKPGMLHWFSVDIA